jgi:hypothetical protein
MAKVYKDLNLVTYDSQAILGATQLSYSSAETPQSQISDSGTFTHFVISGGISGTFSFTDGIQAAYMADKVAASKSLTFRGTDESDVAVTATITNIKTGSAVGGYSSDGANVVNVPFVADSVSSPAAV